MQTIVDILNTLSESMGKDVVKQGAEMWLTMNSTKEFLAAHPGLEFRNEGYISNAPLKKEEQAVLEPYTETNDDKTLYNLRLLAEAVALTAIE